MKRRIMHNKYIVLVFLLFMCLVTLSGCISTGSKTPEELVQRFVQATFTMDGEELFDCMLPEFSVAYRASMQFAASLTGKNPEKELVEEYYQRLAAQYGLRSLDPSKVKVQTIIVSKEEGEATATVHCLLILEIDGQYDYDEGYFVSSKIGESWYFSNILSQRPNNYKPSVVMLSDSMLNNIKNGYSTNRIQQVSSDFSKVNPNTQVVLTNNIVINSAEIQATWDAIDAYLYDPESIERMAMEDYLCNSEYTPFYFELFVKEYRAFNLDSLFLRASVATTEGVNAFKNAFSALMEDAVLDKKVTQIFSVKEQKVAQVIVEYLASLDMSKQAKNVSMIDTTLTITENGTTLLKDIIAFYEHNANVDDVNVEKLLDNVKKMQFIYEINPRQTKVFSLEKILDVDEENVRKVVDKLVEATDGNGLIKISFTSDLGANVKLSFLDEIAQSHGAPTNNLFSVMRREFGNYEAEHTFNNILVGVKGFLWCANSALKSVDAYNQLLVQQMVLNQQKEYLTNIMKCSDYSGAEEMAQYVIDLLTESIAKGVVATIGDTFVASLIGTVGSEIVTDEMAEELLAKAIGGSPKLAKGYMLVFDIGTDVAMIISNAGETKLQTWAVEDAYDEFQEVKIAVASSMTKFYINPTAENYKALYYTVEYYSLLVKSSSKKFSDILVADAESTMSKFRAFLGETEAQRLSDIRSAKEIPAKDLEALNRFRKRLFPTLNFN